MLGNLSSIFQLYFYGAGNRCEIKIVMMKISRIKLFLLPILTMVLTACGGGGSGGGDSPPPLPAIVSLQVTPATTTIPVGFEQQYQAEAKRDDGTVLDVTRNPAVIWSSSDPSIATIDSQGLATGVAPGKVTITASGSANGVSFKRQVTLTITDAIATALQLTPATAKVPTGFEQQFTATVTLSDGSALEVTDKASLSWSSSDPTIATISNIEGRKGRATGVAPGIVTITATGMANGISLTATAQMEVTNETVSALQVTPATTNVPIGLEQQFVAVALLSDGSALEVTDNAALNWSSSDPAIATISNEGVSKGQATGVAAGMVTITASGIANGTPFTATAQMQVTNEIATALQVTPATSEVPVGFEQQFIATALLSDGSALELTDSSILSWSSSNTAIATISNAVGSKGLATGVAPGTVTITASGIANGKPFSAKAQLKVTNATAASLQVMPGTSSVPVGLEQQFTAIALLSDGRSLDVTDNAVLSWSSSDPTIATISNAVGSKGLATAVAPGAVTITASGIANEKPFSITVQMEVTEAVVTTLHVTPTTSVVPVGFEQQFLATALMSDGRRLEVTDNAMLSWSSSDPMIATISNVEGSKGLATGVAAGTVTITASGVANGKPFTTTAQMEVTDAIATALQVAPAIAKVPVGFVQQFTATALLSDGSTLDVTDHEVLNWSSSDPRIATISNAVGSKGVATGVATGTVTITASGIANGTPFSESQELTVTAATLTSLKITPTNETLAMYQVASPDNPTIAFTAVAVMSDGSEVFVSNDKVVWGSDNPYVATISHIGRAIGVHNGITTIMASYNGNNANTQLTVGDIYIAGGYTFVPPLYLDEAQEKGIPYKGNHKEGKHAYAKMTYSQAESYCNGLAPSGNKKYMLPPVAVMQELLDKYGNMQLFPHWGGEVAYFSSTKSWPNLNIMLMYLDGRSRDPAIISSSDDTTSFYVTCVLPPS